MKNLVLTLAIAVITFSAKAQEKTVNITVTIDNVLNDNGTILIGLHNNETFMKGAGLINIQEKAKKGAVTVTFENVEPGTYAVMALHDTNDNKRMDFEVNGMPKESYGMSGNAMVMGLPTFADTKFEVAQEDIELTIRF